MSTTITPAYLIPNPTAPLVDKDGRITPGWWRFIQSLFVITGAGTSSMTLADLIAALANLPQLELLFLQPTGPDTQYRLQQFEAALAAQPSQNSQIDQLRRQIKDLQVLVATIPKTVSGGAAGSISLVTATAPIVYSSGTLSFSAGVGLAVSGGALVNNGVISFGGVASGATIVLGPNLSMTGSTLEVGTGAGVVVESPILNSNGTLYYTTPLTSNGAAFVP